MKPMRNTFVLGVFLCFLDNLKWSSETAHGDVHGLCCVCVYFYVFVCLSWCQSHAILVSQYVFSIIPKVNFLREKASIPPINKTKKNIYILT